MRQDAKRWVCLVLASLCAPAFADGDTRQMVQLPPMMQEHMMANMRDHLNTVNEILALLGEGKLGQAGDVAEKRLGVSSLDAHGASHMAPYMPPAMRDAGTAMHRAASDFALRAQEGDLLPAYRALGSVTQACVACHAGFRVR